MGNNVDVAPFFNVLSIGILGASLSRRTPHATVFQQLQQQHARMYVSILHISSQFHQALLSSHTFTHKIIGARTSKVCVRRA